MEGYSRLASLMGAYPENLIFRRFDAVSAQNILYLQAELVQLEHDFRECALANERSSDEFRRTVFANDWFPLAHANNGTERQWQLMLQIRHKLKEYGGHSNPLSDWI